MILHKIHGGQVVSVAYSCKVTPTPIVIELCDIGVSQELSTEVARSLGWALITSCKDYVRWCKPNGKCDA